MPTYTLRLNLPYHNTAGRSNLITRTLVPQLFNSIEGRYQGSVRRQNIVVNSQEHVLDQDRKALAFFFPADLFNAHYVTVCFHPCFLFRSGERRKKDLETNLDSLRGHVLARTNAPFSLISRVWPSLRFTTPRSAHQNTVCATKRNRMTFRVYCGASTRHLKGRTE